LTVASVVAPSCVTTDAGPSRGCHTATPYAVCASSTVSRSGLNRNGSSGAVISVSGVAASAPAGSIAQKRSWSL
jgi:hypothetical protein